MSRTQGWRSSQAPRVWPRVPAVGTTLGLGRPFGKGLQLWPWPRSSWRHSWRQECWWIQTLIPWDLCSWCLSWSPLAQWTCCWLPENFQRASLLFLLPTFHLQISVHRRTSDWWLPYATIDLATVNPSGLATLRRNPRVWWKGAEMPWKPSSLPQVNKRAPEQMSMGHSRLLWANWGLMVTFPFSAGEEELNNKCFLGSDVLRDNLECFFHKELLTGVF